MVDRALRKQLSEALRRLVTGRMTNDEFDNVYAALLCDGDDRAVAEIAEFCNGLYGDLFPYRLKGRYAVDKPTRRTAARCALFLRTSREYDWPEWPYSTGLLRLAVCIAGLGQTLGCAFGICFLLVLALASAVEGVAFLWPLVLFWPLGALGLASFVFSIWYFALGG